MAISDILIILVLATVPAYFFKKKFGIEVQGPLCLWRTKKGLALLDKFAKYKKPFTYIADIGFIFAFGVLGAGYLYLESKRKVSDILKIALSYAVFLIGASVVAVPVVFTDGSSVPIEFLISLYIGGTGMFILYGLILNTWMIIQNYIVGIVPVPGIAPVIPGVEIEGSPLSVPFHAIFGLIILVVVHEIAHGVVARIEKIRVKSLGILTTGIIPIGAFTEPDEKQMKHIEMRKRMRVFTAGSMSNFIFGTFFMALFLSSLYLAQPTFVQDPMTVVPTYIPWGPEYINYLQVFHVDNNSAAYNAGFENGTKIYNAEIAFSRKEPFAEETFATDAGNITMQRNASGYFGFSYLVVKNTDYPIPVLLEKYLIESLLWIFVLNFLIGVINFLPFSIFDGARIFEDLLNYYAKKVGIKNKKVGSKAVWVLTVFILVLFVVNAMPYFVTRF